MTLSNAKLYGGIGAILNLVGPLVPNVGFVLSIVGLVLVFLAIKIISDETGDRDIFNNFLKAFITAIIGVVLFIGILIGSVGIAVLKGSELLHPAKMMSIIGSILIGFLIFWILFVVSTYFRKKSYELVAQYTSVDMFKTAGLLYFIGGILLIIGIGLIVILVAAILEIVAFFSLPEEVSKVESTPVSS
ncbi:DUF996 domain-containing protein [Pyrococcus sp. ST04]|uniref:DUF996 domain-containing protein n=1 Tax=Pyrococcus sp. ST04 TaxID=1183377 RepID=UPI0002605B28|nr:DUF996 domain-containing protein [Pyrococcus sp. ST04]AFK22837.1 hypothetical protein Py04_1263 [Pyrococcus sp. ST04]